MGKAKIEKLIADLKAQHGVTGKSDTRIEFEAGMKPQERIQALIHALK